MFMYAVVNELYNRNLKISPWITTVLPTVVGVLVCFFHPPFINIVSPASLLLLFVFLAYSVLRSTTTKH